MTLKLLKYTIIGLSIVWIGIIQVNFAKEPARVIAGWVENVRIQNLNFNVKAKLDTGAKTSSIHAKDIELFSKDDKKWVRFALVLRDSEDTVHELKLEKKLIRRVRIKSQDDKDDSRYVVMLDVCFNGRTYSTEFTLSDRDEFIYDVLIGRRFLKRTAIVDVNQAFLTVTDCDKN